jgi:D-alanyl-D-alanine carboxypeptidase/D-alanyl-D-alanine-endopeptidase (penicillin-binding protein 4)
VSLRPFLIVPVLSMLLGCGAPAPTGAMPSPTEAPPSRAGAPHAPKATSTSTEPTPHSPKATSFPGLVWHVERIAGEVIDSRSADRPVNPASVVKVATTLWALQRLGAGHRFETRFGIRGELDRESGRLRGDLLVDGGGDPDFHVENAMLVARALNREGLREVDGLLLVDDRFWIDWEGGSERRKRDRVGRATQMATRLRNALDSAHWNPATRRAWERLVARTGLPTHPEPAVVVRGGVGIADSPDGAWLVVHRGSPLHVTLRRLNAYSNNDIERLGPSLGSASALAEELRRPAAVSEPPIELATLSGLGVNRMTPRQIVGLLRELREEAARQDLDVADLLPVAGCDPGTLEGFPELADAPTAGALTAKTGTLIRTDGGVATLAGYLTTNEGTVIFAAATPGTGDRPAAAREAQARWLLTLASRLGGTRPVECGTELPYSFDDARIDHAASKVSSDPQQAPSH